MNVMEAHGVRKTYESERLADAGPPGGGHGHGARASSWPSWAPRAAASRHCSTWSPGSTRPARARSSWPASPSPAWTRTPWPGCGGAHIGIVFQFFNLLEGMSVLENVTLPAIIAGDRRRQAESRARDLLDLLGLGDKAGSAPGVLSGGQRQRLAIARALANAPDPAVGRRADRGPRLGGRRRGARAVPAPARRGPGHPARDPRRRRGRPVPAVSCACGTDGSRRDDGTGPGAPLLDDRGRTWRCGQPTGRCGSAPPATGTAPASRAGPCRLRRSPWSWWPWSPCGGGAVRGPPAATWPPRWCWPWSSPSSPWPGSAASARRPFERQGLVVLVGSALGGVATLSAAVDCPGPGRRERGALGSRLWRPLRLARGLGTAADGGHAPHAGAPGRFLPPQPDGHRRRIPRGRRPRAWSSGPSDRRSPGGPSWSRRRSMITVGAGAAPAPVRPLAGARTPAHAVVRMGARRCSASCCSCRWACACSGAGRPGPAWCYAVSAALRRGRGHGELAAYARRIDRILAHTVSVAGLTGVVVVVYLVIVVGLGRHPDASGNARCSPSRWLAAAVSALLYGPARQRLTQYANRIVYGEREAPDTVLRALRQPAVAGPAHGRAAAAGGRVACARPWPSPAPRSGPDPAAASSARCRCPTPPWRT